MISIDFDMPINCGECAFINEYYSCDLASVKVEYKLAVRPKGCPLIEVTPQQKVGKWIKTYEPNDAEPCILWMCNKCQNVERGKRRKYCPNCGAKMSDIRKSIKNESLR